VCAPEPELVAAAGMITSALGLVEVPHVEAPAAAADLAARVERHRFPELCELEFLLVPGVRTGPARVPPDGIGATDVMRGEETLCVGLLELGRLRPGGALLNLGSHWKLVSIDAAGRIAASRTTLSGELAFVAQTQTILAGSLPREWPASPDLDWVQWGMELQREAGLPRALFAVRLAEQRTDCTPEQRLSFLLGAVVTADLDPLRASGALPSGAPLVVAGGGAAAAAVRHALSGHVPDLRLLSPEEVEEAQLRGLRAIVGRVDGDG
jgi:2-dehydro-3-deoxygalactonokinase